MSGFTEFSIIQYVPDPIANERMNIGVVVMTSATISVRFVSSWKRAQSFGQTADIEYLKEFRSDLELLSSQARAMYQQGLPEIGSGSRSPQDRVRAMAATWNHQIQLAPFQRSFEAPERLMDRLALRYLKEGRRPQRAGKSKSEVLSKAVEALRQAMPEEMAKDHSVRRWVPARGQDVSEITLDFGLLNGELKAAGQAVSFQTLDIVEIRHQWKEAVWSLVDIRRYNGNLPVSLIVAKPLQNTSAFQKEYEAAMESAQSSGLWVADDTDAEAWAHRVTQTIPV